MAYNKIIYGNQTLVDLTPITATESDVLNGYTFHKSNGELATGNAHYGATVSGTTLNLNGGAYTPNSWNSGTDEEVLNDIDKHRQGLIDLHNYWSLGDERTFTLTNGNKIVLVLSEIDDYATPRWDILFGVEPKYVYETGNINNTATSGGGWANCSRRTWCNTTYLDLFPTSIKSIFKEMNSIYGTTDYFIVPPTSMAKVRRNPSGAAVAHWTGERNSGYGNMFYYINTSGGISSDNVTYNKGLFLLGAIGV